MGRISPADRARPPLHLDEGEHLYASRVRVYPKAVHGPVRRVKWAVLILCLGIYYVLPWIRWDRGPGRPNQALLLDIADRRFYFFDLVIWPQDIFYLTGFLILCAVGLFLVTSIAGRVWCGFTCPQTVWTDLFMWVERLIQGDRTERMRRDAKSMNFDTAWRKALTHTVWMGIAFWTGGAWIMYYVDAPTTVSDFWSGQASSTVYGFIALFTASTYLLAGWAREQVCTFMCPWPRFQAAMLDEQSLIVTYQAWRGEKRGHLKAKSAEKLGDCVDCGACVAACPTGVDIRDGIQLECIGCGLCIDACNEIMTRTNRPGWLITWDSLSRQNAKSVIHSQGGGPDAHPPAIHLLRPRTLIYATAMVAALAVMIAALALHATIGLSVQEDRAPLFVRLADGSVRDAYTIKITNMTQADARFELALSGQDGDLMSLAESHTQQATSMVLPVVADQVGTFRVLVTAPAPGASHKLTFSIRDLATGETTTYHAGFQGPEAGNTHHGP